MIKNGKEFTLGLVLLISFFVVLILMFLPFFNGYNFLQYSDRLFNTFAKHSANYIDETANASEQYSGQQISATLEFENANQAQNFSILLNDVEATTQVEENEVLIEGDLGAITNEAIQDSRAMFNNEGNVVAEKHGYGEESVMFHWWTGLDNIQEGLHMQGSYEQAQFVDRVLKRTIEPAYNFYGIEAESTLDNAGVLTSLLVFYVIYTLWFGFAIFYLFEGLGLSVGKKKKA